MDEFNKDGWLKQLAIDIDQETGEYPSNGEKIIYIDSLQQILQHYFPQIKLIDYDRTPTNTGDSSPELASNTTATLRQSQDEDDTDSGTTNMQMVSR